MKLPEDVKGDKEEDKLMRKWKNTNDKEWEEVTQLYDSQRIVIYRVSVNHALDGVCTMKTRLTLKPGQKGTRNLVNQYGDRLLCVRYRYDEEKKKRLKTIELIIEESEWEQSKITAQGKAIVGLKVEYKEKGIQDMIKKGGGVMFYPFKHWLFFYKEVLTDEKDSNY